MPALVDEADGVTPRWVLVFGAVGLALFVAFVVLHLAGGGFHGHMHGSPGGP